MSSLKTNDNLAAAFSGESQASQKYLAFAKKAEQEGRPNIARLFRTAAEAERVHAEGHLKSLAGIGGSAENLQKAIAGETHEYTTMYPPMIAQAEADGHRAQVMFAYALKTEAVHAGLYRRALEAVERGEDLTEANFYLCPVCGHIEMGDPPERCPICGAVAAKHVRVV